MFICVFNCIRNVDCVSEKILFFENFKGLYRFLDLFFVLEIVRY